MTNNFITIKQEMKKWVGIQQLLNEAFWEKELDIEPPSLIVAGYSPLYTTPGPFTGFKIILIAYPTMTAYHMFDIIARPKIVKLAEVKDRKPFLPPWIVSLYKAPLFKEAIRELKDILRMKQIMEL